MTNLSITSSSLQDLFSRTAIGAERLIEGIYSANVTTSHYPPYDIVATGTDKYSITIAVAGFKREDLEVIVGTNTLTIRTISGFGKAPEVDPEAEDSKSEYPNYIHKGIGKRAFERIFRLMDYVVVEDVTLADGLLVVNLKREVPDALKPRTLQIG